MADRKTQIIDTAADLVQSKSYSSFSYQDLSDALGIRKASIHHHFKTKEDLGVALAEHFRRQYGTRLEEISRFYENPWDLFEAYLAVTSDIMLSAERICAGGVFQSEHNVVPASVQVLITEMMEAIREWLAGVLAMGREGGVMEYPGTPESHAALIVAALQGALQNARAETPVLYRAVVGQLRAGMRTKS
ncbi:MAG: TetR/AcrR family transcriptional regulator [Gemmatimonadetes bacterium]|nr:TetR/AcrR family transcriptional regulator [Gemmatimonadota bacterium]